MFPIEVRRSERIGLLERRARQVALGKIGAVNGHRSIGTQHRDAAGMALSPERFRRGIARGAATHDHDGLRRAGVCRAPRWSTARELRANVRRGVPLFDKPAGYRLQRRRAKRLTGTQAEAGVMPGTAHRLVHQQPVPERGAIVGADGPDREQCGPAPHEQHRFAVRVPEQHGPIGEARERHAPGEVRSAEMLFCSGHPIFSPVSRPSDRASTFAVATTCSAAAPTLRSPPRSGACPYAGPGRLGAAMIRSYRACIRPSRAVAWPVQG